MKTIAITKKPNIIGLPSVLLQQMIGLTVSLSSLPRVAYLGYHPLPKGVQRPELDEGLPFLELADEFYIISIQDVITACLHAGGRGDLHEWCARARNDGSIQFFAVDPEYCEVQL